MNNFEQEREILKQSTEILENLYGRFEVDDRQEDSPDAAILVKTDGGFDSKIGIEITCIDKPKDLRYQNDNKFARSTLCKLDAKKAHLVKKQGIELDKNYLYDGAVRKLKKYNSYKNSNKFSEIILIIFSDIMSFEEFNSEHYALQWARYRFHSENFPYDKVILTNKDTGKSELVYNIKDDTPPKPEIDSKETNNKIITSMHLPIGETHNVRNLAKKKPILPKK
ncbi:MAG: hypothetical protein JJ871_17630 [Thalassospira sp.]|uniref:hypothetical protein n=1 Tax=Thalassospira sp. TaxID=1912094 RepID=UPI001B2AEB1B|nr:hypothetical protein [Thalassospira sp.]MBO6579141.1 hypothetical protein [Thalassospira sp.]MBO6802663.1 hypothetical protein [Thalassospira sp.]MBO6818950.1 hypothetical protein [Thalassospira sp.]MBO6889865.1 hypothetical protein [Thalassospira sp.]